MRLLDAQTLDDAELRSLYEHPLPADQGCLVRGNVVTTVDGAVSGPDGLSGSISGSADKRVFATLRAAADVVLVAAGTARAEGYRPTGLAGPPIAVVTLSGNVPEALTAPDGGTLVYTGVPLPDVLADLAARGRRRVLCEGGPSLFGALAADGLLHEICVTTAPWVLGGSAPRAVTGAGVRLAAVPVHVIVDGPWVMSRWSLAR